MAAALPGVAAAAAADAQPAGKAGRSSKYKGVCWNKRNQRWQTAINTQGRWVCNIRGVGCDACLATHFSDIIQNYLQLHVVVLHTSLLGSKEQLQEQQGWPVHCYLPLRCAAANSHAQHLTRSEPHHLLTP
jgi:hypothetical protein